MSAPRDVDRSSTDRDPIERLVQLAGPREPVPPERLARLKDGARVEWRAHVDARCRTARTLWTGAALATAALALLAIRLSPDRERIAPAPRVEVASIQHVRGGVVRRSQGSADNRVLSQNDRLYMGDRIDTSSDGLLAVQLATGVELRLDRRTRLQLLSTTALAMDTGAIYVATDTTSTKRSAAGDARRAPAVEVRTPLGVARDIGTRFEVRVDEDTLRVRVREGIVSVNEAPPASAGTQLTFGRDSRFVRERVDVFGPDWAWTSALASPFTLEGRSLREFLDWVSAETGLQIRFDRSADEGKATTLTLHGTIEGLNPEQALDLVLPASGVDYVVADGVVTIRGIAGTDGR